MSQPLSIVLRPGRSKRQDRRRPWIVRKLGLDVYGDSLLTERGRAELTALAGMLGVVALFDWLAWTFLFNAILHSRAGAISLKTPIAAGLALLITSMVILFERGFLTMDLTRQKGKVKLRLAFRILVILIAAVVTAKPVELVAFRPAIEKRTHEEKVTTHAINLLLRINELDQERKTLEPVRRGDSESCQSYTDFHQRELGQAKLEAQLDSLRAEQRNAGQELERLRAPAPGEEAAEGRARQLAQAEQRWQRLTAALAQKRALAEDGKIEIKFFRERNPDLKGECDRAFQGSLDDRQKQLTGFAAEKGKIQEHLNVLRQRDPRSVDGLTVRVGEQDFIYRFSEFDVWNQLRILDDLLEGRPARWEGGIDKEVLEQAETLGLKPPPDCSATPCSADEQREWASLGAQARRYSLWSWAVFAVAVLVPCLALLIKFFAPLDLVHYYSLSSQYQAGHPDAIKVLELKGGDEL